MEPIHKWENRVLSISKESIPFHCKEGGFGGGSGMLFLCILCFYNQRPVMQNTQMPLDEQLDRLVERNRELIEALRNLRKRLGVEESVEEQKRAEVLHEEKHGEKEDKR